MKYVLLDCKQRRRNDYCKTSIWRKALIIDWNAPHINGTDYWFERNLCVDRWRTPLIVAMLGVTLSEAVASGTTISGDWGSCGTKQWQDLTHRGAVCWSAKDRSASVQKLKQFSMPVRSVMLVENTTKQYGAVPFKSIHSRLRFHLVKSSRYRNTVNHLTGVFLCVKSTLHSCVYFWENVKVIRMKAVVAWKRVKSRVIEGLRYCRHEKIE